MNNRKTVYPPNVEEKLQHIVEASKQLKMGVELREDSVREEFGTFLMKQWLSGDDDVELDAEGVYAMFKKAAANSLIDGLIDKGLVDTLEGDDTELLFLTEEGKRLFETQTADIKQII
jgi:hypothetical protein